MNSADLSAAPFSPLSPFSLEPILVERIWGTNDLSPWYAGSLPEAPVGEIWLTAEMCKVQGSSASGQTLADVTASLPQQLGDAQGQGFPLLIKLLFPREKLSVQVHPNDTQARALGMPRGKTECWYVLSAEPGAQVAVGFRDPLTPDEVKTAIAEGTLENKMRIIPVKAGDMVFVDAGTVHAIGPSMVVLETQQYSDTTYRLWDYGRPRELHVEAGTAITRSQTAAGLVTPVLMDGFTRLAMCDYFAVDRFSLARAGSADLANEGKLQILIALTEGCFVETRFGKRALPRAQAVVLPTGNGPAHIGASAASEVIRVLQP